MDFFEAQDRAKRNTGKLVVMYILAVIGIIVSVYLVSMFLLTTQAERAINFWNPAWLLVVSISVLIVIFIGTLFRISQLRKGGSAVAELLGGRKVEPSTRDASEQRLMNIVEEMSIASGLPVPDVYVLDREENINAFAAGFGTNDAAVGVTRGALQQLNRDELQGVIAHEFSHIFNGDMRLNIRLIGVLNGILLIHIMGMILMRSMMYSGGMRMGGRNDKGGGNATIVIVLLGLALVVIGYIGMIFGRMIQSAISRQREYLADAAAVQYTRNPDGLAGALNKIASKRKGAEIKDGHAMEMSHLFFASSFHSALDKLFATHPPVEKRIKAIQPSMEAGDEKRKQKIREQFQKDHVSAEADSSTKGGLGGHAALTPEVILGAIGTMNNRNIQMAGKLLQDIPSGLREAAHEPLSAEALIYALLLTSMKDAPETVPDWFVDRATASMSDETDRLMQNLKDAKREWYLPLAELSLPALRHMSKDQFSAFRDLLEQAISISEEPGLFAFALEKMVIHQLEPAFAKEEDLEIRHHHLKTLGGELSVLLSALSHASGKDPQIAWKAAETALEQVKPAGMKLLPPEECGIPQLDKALDELAHSANPVKKYILSAVIHCVISDRQITTEEKELVRAISETLDSPIPLGAMG